jgi:hypothetical protein
METGDKQEVNLILRQFKLDNGLTNYNALLEIPKNGRIPQLAAQNFHRINLLIIAALKSAFESITLKKYPNEFQIMDLSEAIIDTANEDNLAFEDLMIFLQRLVRGQYEIPSNITDIGKFLEVFEVYRQERWEELKRIRDEIHTQHKVCGDTGKSTQRDELSEHFSNFGSRINEMKNIIENLKMTNNSLKMDNL